MAPRTSTSAPKPAASKPAETPLTPSAAQQAAYTHSIADLELPKTTLTKLAKGSIPDNVKMQQDVVHALLRGSTLFINYLSAAAHDQALHRSGKQITAGDVLKAIADLDFGPADALIPILEQELASYRAAQAAAKARKPPPKSRRKSAAGDAIVVDGDEEQDDEEEEDGEEGDEDGEEGGEGEEGEEGDEGEGDDGKEEEGDENGA